MAQNYVSVEKAAEILGVSPDAVRQMRDNRQLYGYRDGATWKFKAEDVEKLIQERAAGKTGSDDDDEGDILLSEVELGQSSPSSTGSVLGMELGKGSDVSDIQIVDSQLKPLTTTAQGQPGGAAKAEKPSASKVQKKGPPAARDDSVTLDDSVVGRKSGLKAAADSGFELDAGQSDLNVLSRTASEATVDVKPKSDVLADDDLVLGGSGSGGGSDVTIGGDSGISLVDPADSGLSLEEPLDLAAPAEESLELGEDDMISLAEEDVDTESATQLKADDDFLLTPATDAGDEEDSESGSQVIALDTEGSSAEDRAAVAPAVSAAVAMLEEDLTTAPVGLGTRPGLAPAMGAGVADLAAGAPLGMAIQTLPEAPYSVLDVVGLTTCVVLLALAGMMTYELIQNVWSWGGTSPAATSLMDMVLGLFEK